MIYETDHDSWNRPRELRKDMPHVCGVFFGLFFLYLWSMPATVVMEDDGLFLTTIWSSGVAHPPGYPLYVLLGELAVLLPFGSVALRVHLLSGLLGAIVCVCLWYLLRRLLPERGAATLGALALGVSQAFWSQAIIAEVYILNVLLFLCLLLLCMRCAELPEKKAAACLPWLGLLYGLGLSNHWPLLALSTPGLACVLWPRRRVLWRQLPRSLPGLCLGLLPYAWMVSRSLQDPLISFYGPLDSWGKFWFFVSREGYAEVDQSSTAGWWDKGQYLLFVLREVWRQFSPAGVALILYGFFHQWRWFPRSFCIGLVLVGPASILLLVGSLGFDYVPLEQSVFRVYPLLFYLVCAVWLACGVSGVFRRGWWFVSCLRFLPAALSCGLLALSVSQSLPENYRARDFWARDYAVRVLSGLPENAALFLGSDMEVGSVMYMSLVEKVRQDVRVYSPIGIFFANRLFQPFEATENLRRTRLREHVLRNAEATHYVFGYENEYGTREWGATRQVLPNQTKDVFVFVPGKKELEWYRWLSEYEPHPHPWNLAHHEELLGLACANIVAHLKRSVLENADPHALTEWRRRLCVGLEGKLVLAEDMLSGEKADWERAYVLLQRISAEKRKFWTKRTAALWGYYMAVYYHQNGQKKLAKEHALSSASLWKDPAHLKDLHIFILEETSSEETTD